MATYFHSNSEFQGAAADGLQTLIFMNPAYNHPPPPTIFLNSNSNSKQHFSPPPPQDVSAFLYNLPVAKQGLSLTLSSHHPPAFQSGGGSPPPESALLTSKYLKAAQELLDEVVKVGQSRNTANSSATAGEDTVKRELHLTTAERQEIQMKKAKLVNMLDEVEQRYRQYHHQMQIVIAWFERAAGIGSAKSYTDLALQTISKQFRCLKDAILAQIRAATKSLGEDDTKMDGSRLKYVDNQIRQQRALQQLGMIQNNAWRPQRGLPERSVSVLRAWLFEHFLHPYPKDSDKLMLAKQTGLTRSQVSNWFINARVRLWKPMVEEMYMEEMKEHGSETSDHNEDPKSPAPEQDNDNQMSPKKLRNSPEMLHSPSTDNEHISMGFTLMGAPTNFIGGFGSYPIGELGSNQFQAPPPYSGNGVSLTLGLPHCEGHQSFQSMQLGRGVVIGEANDDFNGHVYDHDGINIQRRSCYQTL